MLQLRHKQLIVNACYPETLKEANELWHDIKPVKFGDSQPFGTNLKLATYQIPNFASYMLILRTELYMTSMASQYLHFGQFIPPPEGQARWVYTDIDPVTPQYRISPDLPLHLYGDTDEFLFAKGDHRVSLVALIQPINPGDAIFLVIRTVVYAYLLGALVADRIGASETTYSTVQSVQQTPIPPVRPPVTAPIPISVDANE
jgi:hypothetical protein